MEKVLIISTFEEKGYTDQFALHLNNFNTEDKIKIVHIFDQIMPGDNKRKVIRDEFRNSDIIIAFISAKFLNLYCDYTHEFEIISKKHMHNTLKFIPVLLSTCHWDKCEFLSELSILPLNQEPILSKSNKDNLELVYANLAEKIMDTITKPPKTQKSDKSHYNINTFEKDTLDITQNIDKVDKKEIKKSIQENTCIKILDSNESSKNIILTTLRMTMEKLDYLFLSIEGGIVKPSIEKDINFLLMSFCNHTIKKLKLPLKLEEIWSSIQIPCMNLILFFERVLSVTRKDIIISFYDFGVFARNPILLEVIASLIKTCNRKTSGDWKRIKFVLTY